jgi:hypothetical protein
VADDAPTPQGWGNVNLGCVNKHTERHTALPAQRQACAARRYVSQLGRRQEEAGGAPGDSGTEYKRDQAYSVPGNEQRHLTSWGRHDEAMDSRIPSGVAALGW